MTHSARRLFYRGFAEHDHISVEDGEDQVGVTVARAFESSLCPNCGSRFSEFVHRSSNSTPRADVITYAPVSYLLFCNLCGWWQLRQDGLLNFPAGDTREGLPSIARHAYQYHSILEDIDIASDNIVYEDLRTHLIRRWDDRRFISAAKAEELVAAILKEHLKCDVHHSTAHVNTPDGGVDLFVCSDSGHIKAAVQVKRRIRSDVESVEPIRSFVGALVIEGYDNGIFVTTATHFSPAAKRVPSAPHVKNRRLKLELIDGQRLLELLQVNSPPDILKLPSMIRPDAEWVGADGRSTSLDHVLGTRLRAT